jgi:methionine-rich copper-binding protein CopC
VIKKILTLCAVLLLTSPINAFAHGEVTSSIPSPNEKIVALPTEISIDFDGELQTLGNSEVNSITVTDAQGQIISNPTSVVAGSRISNRLLLTDVTGLVSVHYRIVSEDGHPVEGDYSFTVGEVPTLTSVQGEELTEVETGASEESGSNLLVKAVGVAFLSALVVVIVRRIKK